MNSARSAAPTNNGQKITISKRELERLIKQEVDSSIKRKGNRLDALIENIQQQLVLGMDYEASFKTLQTHMMEVADRAEQALAYIAQNPTQPPGDTSRTRARSDSTMSEQITSVAELMKRTKREFERLHAENAALRAAFEDVQQEQATLSPTKNTVQKNRVMKGLAKLLHNKRDTSEQPEEPCSPPPAPVQRIKEELEADWESKKAKCEPEVVPYPPLPVLPFPSSLPIEAVKYSIPPKLKVDLALIKKPSPQLSLVWSLAEDEPNAPPMATYSIYLTTEVAIGSNVFDGWQKLGEHAAAPLPMFSLYTKYTPGYKICVSVVGKDKYGRYGPYSEVTCVYI